MSSANKMPATFTNVEAEIARLVAKMQAYRSHVASYDDGSGRTIGHYHSCPERAAVRRASMDVTRALARFRSDPW